MSHGERVREIRKEMGMTLESFAKRLGVGKTAISKLENGDRNLTEQMARSICREYNVNYDYLIYGEGAMFGTLPQTTLDELCNQYNLDELDRQIIDLYVSFPKELREEVKKLIKERFTKE